MANQRVTSLWSVLMRQGPVVSAKGGVGKKERQRPDNAHLWTLGIERQVSTLYYVQLLGLDL